MRVEAREVIICKIATRSIGMGENKWEKPMMIKWILEVTMVGTELEICKILKHIGTVGPIGIIKFGQTIL